jgi:hypothetical protein
MDVKFKGFPEVDDRIAYVREVDVADLPEEVQQEAGGLKKLYAVYSAEGERMAVVRERHMAFVLARQNDYAPVPVH